MAKQQLGYADGETGCCREYGYDGHDFYGEERNFERNANWE